MLLARKETHISMEHNRKSRNESTLTWLLIFDKGGQDIHWGKDSPPQNSQCMVVGKLEHYMQKNQTGLLFNIMHKNKFKTD